MQHISVVAGAITLLLVPLLVVAQENSGIEARVRAYFSDAPVMANIAECESKFRQFAVNGEALHGGYGSRMIGVFQIYSDIHAEYAKERGMDIYTLEGNLAYARYLYEREGTVPWNSSAHCWRDMPVAESASVVTQAGPTQETAGAFFTRTLSTGMESEEVRTLQRFLNNAGFTVASDGPGSPGNETIRFGSLTRAAVQKFQCAKAIVCSGDGYSTGYGIFGPQTRAALLAAQGTTVVSAPAETTSLSIGSPQEAEIARLQAQVAELQQKLTELLAARSS